MTCLQPAYTVPPGLHHATRATTFCQQRNGNFLWFPQGASKALASYAPLTHKPPGQLAQQVFMMNQELTKQAPHFFDYIEGLNLPQQPVAPLRWRNDWLAAIQVTRAATKQFFKLGDSFNPTNFQPKRVLKYMQFLDDGGITFNEPEYLNSIQLYVNDIVHQPKESLTHEPAAILEHVYKPFLPEGKSSHLISSILRFPPENATDAASRYEPTKAMNTFVNSTLQQWGFEEGSGKDYRFKPMNPFLMDDFSDT